MLALRFLSFQVRDARKGVVESVKFVFTERKTRATESNRNGQAQKARAAARTTPTFPVVGVACDSVGLPTIVIIVCFLFSSGDHMYIVEGKVE